jgi:hypothetical protein
MNKVISGCGIVNFCQVTLVFPDVIPLEYITAVIKCGSYQKHYEFILLSIVFN